MAKRLLIGGGVLLAVLVIAIASTLVWAMNRGVHTASGKLANAAQFLTSRTSAWESGLPKDGITRADDSGCYFVMSEENDQTAGDYACGPVLRPDVTKQNAWDLYKFSISADQATNPQPGAGVSQGLPAGTYLADENGSRQKFDLAGLKVPPYPRLAAGTVLPQAEFSVADADKGAQIDVGADARLVGLGKVFTVASVQEVSKATATGQVAQAAEGQKLYLLTLGPEVPAPNSLSGTNTLSLSVDDKETTLLGGSDAQVLFSAADKASLVLDAAGQKQSLDLKNGVRQGNPRTEPLYSTNFPVSSDRSVTVNLAQTRGPDGAPYDMTGKVTRVAVSPFLDGEWAPEGQIFVDVTMTNDAQTTDPRGRTFIVDCAASTVDGGTVNTCGPGPSGGSRLTMTAPAGASAAVSYAPTLKVTGGGKAPVDVTFAPKAFSIPLS